MLQRQHPREKTVHNDDARLAPVISISPATLKGLSSAENKSPSGLLVVLRLPDVQGRTGRSRSSIYAMLKQEGKYHDPSFPRPFHIGQSSVGWFAHEIEAWIATRAANRCGGAK